MKHERMNTQGMNDCFLHMKYTISRKNIRYVRKPYDIIRDIVYLTVFLVYLFSSCISSSLYFYPSPKFCYILVIEVNVTIFFTTGTLMLVSLNVLKVLYYDLRSFLFLRT